MFNLREINQMERDIRSYSEWELTAANTMMSCFVHLSFIPFAPFVPPSHFIDLSEDKLIIPVVYIAF